MMYWIQPSPGKGMGLFAGRAIRRGERISSETPLCSQTLCEQSEEWYKMLKVQFDGLDPEGQATYLALPFRLELVRRRLYPLVKEYLADEEGINDEGALEEAFRRFLKIMAIFVANRIVIGSKVEDAFGIFAIRSRINHSCIPNASADFNEKTGHMEVYAVRDLEDGEEITISYIDVHFPSGLRNVILDAAYGFTCDCAACEGPEKEVREERRNRLFELQPTLYTMTHRYTYHAVPPTDTLQRNEDGLRLSYEYVALLKEEGIVGRELSKGYEYCGFWHLVKHEIQQATEFNEKAMENRRAWLGRELEFEGGEEGDGDDEEGDDEDE
ncbi:SET domain-containing protein [Hypoxylon sp. FL1857]|nr:SET domain-containing protein [Hypoxylon sp. FL1857]